MLSHIQVSDNGAVLICSTNRIYLIRVSRKASIFSRGIIAFLMILAGTITSSFPVSKQFSIPARVFITIQGQLAQLLQVAPVPLVGAIMKVLSGDFCCILYKIPISVATIKILFGSFSEAAKSWEVEPTTSANSITAGSDSGWTNTAASGYSDFSCAILLALNFSWTTHEPCHNSISAPVSRWT